MSKFEAVKIPNQGWEVKRKIKGRGWFTICDVYVVDDLWSQKESAKLIAKLLNKHLKIKK